jgi:hypothetical protein
MESLSGGSIRMNLDAIISLLITKADSPPRYQLDIKVNGALLLSNRQFFNLWLAPHWERIRKSVPKGQRSMPVIASPESEILNLPWELAMTPESRYLGIDPLFSVRRLPYSGDLPGSSGELWPQPLRLLFMASGGGKMCIEDKTGQTDLKSSQEICLRLAGRGVQYMFVSGCQTGKLPDTKTLGGICQGLVNNGVPLAIGWPPSTWTRATTMKPRRSS